MRILLPIALALCAASCSWVKLSEGGNGVALRNATDISTCQQVAQTTVQVRSKVLLQRSPEKVTQELHVLARNIAAERGGNTVVPASPVRDGERTYDIYRCAQ